MVGNGGGRRWYLGGPCDRQCQLGMLFREFRLATFRKAWRTRLPFSPSGAGDHVGTDTQADRAFFSTGKSDDAGREAASWKGTSCVRRRQHALFARLQNSSGSALRMALIWSHTYHSFQERATNEAEEVPSRSHKHNLWSNFGEPSARPEAAAGKEVARACASDQKRASHGTESHQLEASCDLRRLLREECWACRLALHPRSSWDKVQDEWREALANRHDAEPTPMERRKTVSAWTSGSTGRRRKAHRRKSCLQILRECIRCQRAHEEGARPHEPREPLWTETSGNRYRSKDKRNEEIGKYCEQDVAAIKKIRFTRRISCQGLRTERRRRPHQDHLHEGLLWRWSCWSDTVANQLLRVHSRGRCFAWERRVCVVEQAPRFLRDRAARSVQIRMIEHTTLEDLAAICLKRFEALVVVRFWCQTALCWQLVITKCFSTSSWSRVLTQRW